MFRGALVKYAYWSTGFAKRNLCRCDIRLRPPLKTEETNHENPASHPVRFIAYAGIPLLAQEAHQHHGDAVAASPAPAVESIAAAGRGGCEKCKKAGAGDTMAGGGGMGETGGMMCCKGKQGGGSGMGGKSCCGGMHGGGDTVALERRISELEKRLDLLQQQKTH